MKITQIRNATNKIEFGGKTFLIDPWLQGRHELCFIDIPGHPYHTEDPIKENIPMPFYDLIMSPEKIQEGVDFIIVTHIHPDHIDMALDGTVGATLNKNIPLFCQNRQDYEVFIKSGFKDVKILDENGTDLDGVKITKTKALHGTVVPCGEACGVIFEHKNEDTLYLAGDTIWYSEVAKTLNKYNPAVVMLNCCGAELVENGRLIMHDEDVASVHKASPVAKLYLTHFNNVAHASFTRHSMKAALLMRNVSGYFMPEDGETVEFN